MSVFLYSPSTTIAPMGLSLSVWLYSRAADIPPSPPSAFKPRAVPASSPDRRSHWSSVHRSPNLLLSRCKREVTRSPAELSSDGVRAEVGVRSGLHVWEVVWSPCHRGSHAVLGVSKQDCPLQASGYNVLVGGDLQSWGWELKTNQLWHGVHPMVLDADAATLGFVVDGCFLGAAFKDLPRGVELFPAVSSVRGGANIRLRYLNGDPPALMALCGLSIQQCLRQQWQTDKLPLPPVLQQYLLPHH
uniref:Si:ch1073-228j22.2 n=1 Tax=Salarias fasciatus TaxID=181472 RepID=A0A672GTW0_SALFA